MLKRFTNALRKLFQSNTASEGPAQRAARLEEKVVRLVDNMPTMPDTATRAMALLDDRDVKFSELAALIERDAAIATGLLRIANSVLFAGGAPALKLGQAIVRIGSWQCKNLIMAIGLRSLFRGKKGEVPNCRALWHHGFVTASLCVQINRECRLGLNGEEYSAGLLHDLGRILIALADPECLELAGAMDFHEDGDVLDRERAAIGIDHCALGGWFSELSNLPEALTQAIRFHHNPDQTDDVRRLVALVATADHMANHLQRNERIEDYDPNRNIGLAFLSDRWTPARQEHFLDKLPTLMEAAVQAAARENALG